MTLKSLGPIAMLLLGACAAADAGVVNMTSNYGVTFSITDPCIGCIGTTDGALINGEDFIDSNNLLVFDFQVTDLPGNYTIDLTATDASITDNYGLFTCPSPALTPPAPQCSNDLPQGVTISSDYGSLNASDNVAFLPVTGAASSDTFVFFAELDKSSGTVTANIESAVPEPHLLPFLSLGLLVAFVLLRRWRVAH